MPCQLDPAFGALDDPVDVCAGLAPPVLQRRANRSRVRQNPGSFSHGLSCDRCLQAKTAHVEDAGPHTVSRHELSRAWLLPTAGTHGVLKHEESVLFILRPAAVQSVIPIDHALIDDVSHLFWTETRIVPQ